MFCWVIMVFLIEWLAKSNSPMIVVKFLGKLCPEISEKSSNISKLNYKDEIIMNKFF